MDIHDIIKLAEQTDKVIDDMFAILHKWQPIQQTMILFACLTSIAQNYPEARELIAEQATRLQQLADTQPREDG